MDSKFTQLYKEVKVLRRDVEEIEEIKEMLIPEVPPTEEELKAIEEGKRGFARGEFEEWSEVRKRVSK